MFSRAPIQSAFVLALTLAIGSGCHQQTPIPAGDIVPTLIAPTVGDAVFDPETLRGKPAIVMFVSPTCSHCIAELPRAQAIATEKGIATVAVFVSGNADAAIATVQKTGFKGTVLVDDGKLLNRFSIKSVPYMLVLNKDGTAAGAFIGEQDDDTIRDAIAGASS